MEVRHDDSPIDERRECCVPTSLEIERLRRKGLETAVKGAPGGVFEG
jgi:hypothetical protein